MFVVFICFISPDPLSHVLTGPNYWVFKCSVSPDSSLIASVCNLDTVSSFIDLCLISDIEMEMYELNLFASFRRKLCFVDLDLSCLNSKLFIKECVQTCMLWGRDGTVCSYRRLNFWNGARTFAHKCEETMYVQ